MVQHEVGGVLGVRRPPPGHLVPIRQNVLGHGAHPVGPAWQCRTLTRRVLYRAVMRLEPQELTTEQAMSRLGASMQHAAASMGMSLAQFGKAALEVSRAFKVPDPDEKMVALMSEEPVEDLTAISAAAELWKSRDDLAQQMAKAFGTNKPADLNVYDSKVCVDSVACYWREDNAGWELLVTCSRMGTYGSPGPIETQFVIHRILAELEVHQFAKEVTSWKH